MTLDDSAADRLLTFCGKLPALPADRSDAEREARFALDCFARRLRALETAGQGGGGPGGHDLAAVRCEVDALEAARRVITQLWERRFGAVLTVG